MLLEPSPMALENGAQKRQVVESHGLFMTDSGHEPSPVLGLEAGEAPHHTML